MTQTETMTITPTVTQTETLSFTPTPTMTQTVSHTITITEPTPTPTMTQTHTETTTLTITPSQTVTHTLTIPYIQKSYDSTNDYSHLELVVSQPISVDGIAINYEVTNTITDYDGNRTPSYQNANIPNTLEDGIPQSRYAIVSTNGQPLPFNSLFLKTADNEYRMPFVSIKGNGGVQVKNTVYIVLVMYLNGQTETFEFDNVGTYTHGARIEILDENVEGNIDGNVEA